MFARRDLAGTGRCEGIHVRSSPKSHPTISVMASYCADYAGLDHPTPGGTLCILPREVRDEIYRLVVTDCEVVCVARDETSNATIRTHEHEFAILKVSKAINHEVSEVWLSECVFRFTISPRFPRIIRLPAKLSDRIKNVRIVLPSKISNAWAGDWRPKVHYDPVFKATFAPFTGTRFARNTLDVILLYPYAAGIIYLISDTILEAFKALTGFRTVFIHVVFQSHIKYRYKLGSELDELSQGLKNKLEPTLGTATESASNKTLHLTFHPRKKRINATK